MRGGERGEARKVRLEGLEVGIKRQGLRSGAVVLHGPVQCLPSFQIQRLLVTNSEMVPIAIGQEYVKIPMY